MSIGFDIQGVQTLHPFFATTQGFPGATTPKTTERGNALVNAVQSRFYFPRLVMLSRQYVFQYPWCQKLAKKKSQLHTYGYDITGSPGEKGMLGFCLSSSQDQTGERRTTNTSGCVYEMGFMLGPVKNQTADTVIKILIRDYIPLRGVPAVVHSDNGPAFIAQSV